MLSRTQKTRIFNDPRWEMYFRGSEFLDSQASFLVPDEWRADQKKWLSPEVRMAIFDLHVDFLESLFDSDGFITLYRAMDRHPRVKPGDMVDLGEFWTYSGDAFLGDAQIASGASYKTGFAARVSFDQIDWPQTIADHTGRWDGEKQMFVKGSVEIVDVFPYSEWSRHTKKRSFEKWLMKELARR